MSKINPIIIHHSDVKSNSQICYKFNTSIDVNNIAQHTNYLDRKRLLGLVYGEVYKVENNDVEIIYDLNHKFVQIGSDKITDTQLPDHVTVDDLKFFIDSLMYDVL